MSVQIHGNTCKISFSILPIEEIEVLLGLDWFKQTLAVFDPTNEILKFPSKEVCLKDEGEIVLEEHDECYLVNNRLAFETDVEEDCRSKNLIEAQNADISAQTYKELGTCLVSKHSIRTTNEDPIFIRPYRRSYSY